MTSKLKADNLQKAIKETKRQSNISRSNVIKIALAYKVNPRSICRILELKKWSNGRDEWLV